MSSSPNPSKTDGTPGLFGRILLFLDGSRRFRAGTSVGVFVLGLLIWISIQGPLAVIPLWTRALPPETDDSLSYVLKSRQMEDCFNQDCQALKDLRAQLMYGRWKHPSSYEERILAASRIFPVYHPLLSVVIVGLKNMGMDWMTAYKAIWSAGPVLFCIAFAYLLVKLFGLPAAGLALGLLAFKIFPDTGLHYVVPSNLTMAMAAIVWARIISKRGRALVILIVGSLVMVATHPVGIIYSLMGIFIALAVSEYRPGPKMWATIGIVLGIAIIAFFISKIVQGPFLPRYHILPKGDNPFIKMFVGAGKNMTEFIAGILRLEPGLLGNPGVFFGAVSFGILTLPHEKRRPINRTLVIYALSILALMFYVSSHPGDVIFRMWIPFVVILFGAVGQALWHCLGKTWDLCVEKAAGPHNSRIFSLARSWPIVALTILLGYSVQMSIRGGEQVYAVEEHMKTRQPLRLESSQVDKLLAMAHPGDRVLYTSMIIMPYYLIHGAMDLGAVYYHPSMRGSRNGERWINRPDVRFAVTYNPTVYHPAFEGLKESSWWVQSPEFRVSPLNSRRTHGPMSREGFVPVDRFKWIEIAVRKGPTPDTLRIKIDNPDEASSVSVTPVGKGGEKGKKGRVRKKIPGEWKGWIEFDLTHVGASKKIRLDFPKGENLFSIGGVVFGHDPLNWPWAQNADMYFMFKNADTGLVKISFNPSRILPSPLNRKRISVLDDQGSSVLFRIHQ